MLNIVRFSFTRELPRVPPSTKQTKVWVKTGRFSPFKKRRGKLFTKGILLLSQYLNSVLKKREASSSFYDSPLESAAVVLI